MDRTNIDDLEATYENRNETIRHAIDALAAYDPGVIQSHGMKTEIARTNDLEPHRIYYVLDRWQDLVEYRRHAATDPLDSEAVTASYDDETMQALSQRTPVADGAGDIRIDITLTLDEVFRAIKLLPGDLGLKVYSQTLSQDFDRSIVTDLLDGGD